MRLIKLLRQGQSLAGARLASSAAGKKVQLVEVGRLEEPSEETYRDAQVFIHTRLGYRGIVLFSWDAEVRAQFGNFFRAD